MKNLTRLLVTLFKETWFSLWRGRRPIKYIFFSMFFPFLLKTCILTALISLCMSLQYLDDLPIRISFKYLAQIILLSYINVLPIAIIISLFSTVLLTYRRLAANSELITLKALGLSNIHYLIPAIALGILASSLSMPTLFYWAPSMNNQLESIASQLPQKKYTDFIKQGVFSQFFNFTIYVRHIDSEKNLLKNIFVYYNETENEKPFFITAQSGELNLQSSKDSITGFLHLKNGGIHQSQKDSYTRTNFKENMIPLVHKIPSERKKKKVASYSISEIKTALIDKTAPPKKIKKLYIEFHHRWTLSTICLIFAILGVGLGMRFRQRMQNSNGIVLTTVVLFIYFILSVALYKLAYIETLPIPLTMWIPNIFFAILSVISIKRNSSQHL